MLQSISNIRFESLRAVLAFCVAPLCSSYHYVKIQGVTIPFLSLPIDRPQQFTEEKQAHGVFVSFESLNLSKNILKAIAKQNYKIPTPIQMQAIPVIMEGSDILAAAQTGTGKTAGFTLPILNRLESQPGRTGIRALVLTPTRELAAQVELCVKNYAEFTRLKSAVVFGGVNINNQIKILKAGVDILVATPGRLLDHLQQKTVDLSKVEILVLDEADRMLDMGFLPDINRILKIIPKNRQSLMFSATYSPEIKSLASKFLNNPQYVEVAKQTVEAETINQTVHIVDHARKRNLLSFLIGSKNWRQVLVFTRTKHTANRLSQFLLDEGLSAAAIHGNKSQGARTKALEGFKAGKIRVLVATDIAARGLDIDQLPHVINYELPNVSEDYVHRIGRTGRAGLTGEALSLVCIDEFKLLEGIETLIRKKITRISVPGFEPNPLIKAQPIPNGRNSKPGRPRKPSRR